MEASLRITCGIDWAENHHDVALVDEAGKLVAKRRIGDDVQGYQQLLALLAEAGDSAGEPVPVAVETARGLLISPGLPAPLPADRAGLRPGQGIPAPRIPTRTCRCLTVSRSDVCGSAWSESKF
jgi:hypothetical protein